MLAGSETMLGAAAAAGGVCRLKLMKQQ